VDDHKLFAEAVRPSLENLGMRVAIVTTGAEATAVAMAAPPDLALVDIGLPDTDGITLGAELLAIRSDMIVLALTAMHDARKVSEALAAGFRGFLTKDLRIARFVNAVRTALEGEVVIPSMSARAVGGVRSPSEEHARLVADSLTAREREVLGLLAVGASGREIAREMHISMNTVRTHVQSVLTKLQVHSRLEAATFAVHHGLVTIHDRDAYAADPDLAALTRST
jgi:two-component system nitrate/nitrite response regulator NarL